MKARTAGASSDWYRWLLIAVSLALIVPIAIACGDDDDDDTDGGSDTSPTTASEETPDAVELGEVDVMGVWGGEELTSFEAMVAPWEDEGGTVNFTGSRGITSELTLRVEGGNPPDVAIPPEIGLFAQFAREGELITLDECEGLGDLIRDKYPESFVELGTIDGELYGFFMKADTKATVWYNPGVFEEHGVDPLGAESSFDDLVALSEQLRDDGIPPWSIGLESDAVSGWPGSDWLQQIILNEFGEETYDGLVDGSVPFTDPDVKAAFEMFGEIALGEGMTVQGGATGINATNFQDSAYPPFQTPPAAAMLALGGFAGGFITTQFPDAAPGEDFDFFTFPGGKVTGGANIVYAFNNDPTTCAFLEYLAGGEAQEIWVEAGGFTSVNTDVNLDSYPNDVARKQAEQLLDAETFRFDLDDAIGGAVQTAYFQGITEYISNPSSLDTILEGVEASR